MGDATSRLSRQDAASALHHYAAQLQRADAAVRVGRDLGVARGADAFLDAVRCVCVVSVVSIRASV